MSNEKVTQKDFNVLLDFPTFWDTFFFVEINQKMETKKEKEIKLYIIVHLILQKSSHT